MADDKISLPMGGGGLMRYSEEGSKGIKIKPETVIVLIVLVIAFEAALRLL